MTDAIALMSLLKLLNLIPQGDRKKILKSITSSQMNATKIKSNSFVTQLVVTVAIALSLGFGLAIAGQKQWSILLGVGGLSVGVVGVMFPGKKKKFVVKKM